MHQHLVGPAWRVDTDCQEHRQYHRYDNISPTNDAAIPSDWPHVSYWPHFNGNIKNEAPVSKHANYRGQIVPKASLDNEAGRSMRLYGIVWQNGQMHGILRIYKLYKPGRVPRLKVPESLDELDAKA